MLVSNVNATQTVKAELVLMMLEEYQSHFEKLTNELDDLVTCAIFDASLNPDDDDEGGDYKYYAVLWEISFIENCKLLGVGVDVISDAYSCPRFPQYKCYLYSNRNIFKFFTKGLD